jgi:putative SOS response-associated peptidase YedK
VTPTDPLPVVRDDAKDHQRRPRRHALGPGAVLGQGHEGRANINAKAEGIGNKPALREAFRQRRRLVPVDNFYEWKKIGGGKQPYAIGLKGRRPDGPRRVMGELALAGRRTNARLRHVTIEPNELCAELHNRMPLVLAPEAWPAWLGDEPAGEQDLKAILAPTLRMG